jgi:archaellum biogenesis ATPase FlaH
MALTQYQEERIKELATKENDSVDRIIKLVDGYMLAYECTFEEALDRYPGNEMKIILMSEAEKYQGKEDVVPTGFPILDEPMRGGIAIGSTVVVAAPSGHGKTAFLVTLSYGFLKQNVDCLWFSYEETHADVWERFKTIGADPLLPAYCPLELSDTKLDFIESVIKKYKRTKDFFVVFIDQLSYLAPKLQSDININQINGNYSMYLGEVARQLKTIAMEQKIIIIFAHQLGRQGELAYSEAVKNATSKALFLNREIAKEDSDEEFTENTFLTFKKNRVPGGGKNPRLTLTVEGGLFVEKKQENEMVEYAKKVFGKGTKEVNKLFK